MANLSLRIDIRSTSEEEAVAYFEQFRRLGIPVEIAHRQIPYGDGTKDIWFVKLESPTAEATVQQLTQAADIVAQVNETHPIHSEW